MRSRQRARSYDDHQDQYVSPAYRDVCPIVVTIEDGRAVEVHDDREAPLFAPVVAQTWRGGSRQALLARLLFGCHVEALDHHQARSVGALAARAAATDIIDVTVVEGALRRGDLVVSSDSRDLELIASSVGRRRLEVEPP